MKTLHIHIGTSKTATTAIQAFCRDNVEILDQKGYSYPIFPFSYGRIPPQHNGIFLVGVVWDKEKDRERALQEEENFREGMKIVQKLFQTYDDVILSDESIWRKMDSSRKNFWERMEEEAKRGGFSLHVIVYLRRQDQWLISLWSQAVKMQNKATPFESYIKETDPFRYDYYGKLERMAAVVGKENITVRRFERGRFEGGSIYSDFLFAVGLSLTDEYMINQEKVNIKLCGNEIEIKRILNELPQLKEDEFNRFIVKCLQESSRESEYYCEMYSKGEIEAFLEECKEGNRKVAEEYLHEPGMELFDYTVKDIPKWQKGNLFMEDALIRFIGDAMYSLYQENKELKYQTKILQQFTEQIKHPFRTIFFRLKRRFSRKSDI